MGMMIVLPAIIILIALIIWVICTIIWGSKVGNAAMTLADILEEKNKENTKQGDSKNE